MRAWYRKLRYRIATSETVTAWRRKRYELFVRVVGLEPDDTILDVGPGVGGALAQFNRTNPIVALDRHEDARDALERRPNVTFVLGDGARMPFGDREFGVVFCNSVVEHVDRSERERFASEIRRVGERYFVQTPNKHFPIEPHYMLPFIQYLPRPLRRLTNRALTDAEDGLELLTKRELCRLFPDASIVAERKFGLTKSLIAFRQRPLDDPSGR